MFKGLMCCQTKYCPLKSEFRISTSDSFPFDNSILFYPQEYVSLLQASDNTDIAAKLISEGLLRAENRREKKVAKLVRILYTALQ